MITQYTQSTTTLHTDMVFLFPFAEVEKPSEQNTEKRFGFFITTGTIDESIYSLDIPELFAQDPSASIPLNYDEEIESGVTQEFADSQVEPFNFLSYTEEDLLDWDAAIITPPTRPSGTIRVKLKYKGRSKPFPVDSFWEE